MMDYDYKFVTKVHDAMLEFLAAQPEKVQLTYIKRNFNDFLDYMVSNCREMQDLNFQLTRIHKERGSLYTYLDLEVRNAPISEKTIDLDDD